MANVDYYDIDISDYTRTMTVANVVDTLAAEIPGGRHARELGADELRQRFAHAGDSPRWADARWSSSSRPAFRARRRCSAWSAAA